MYQIENIPPPRTHYQDASKRGGRRSEYPFPALQVGQSFIVPRDRAHATAEAGSYYKSKHPGWDYTRTAQTDGVRFYRIA